MQAILSIPQLIWFVFAFIAMGFGAFVLILLAVAFFFFRRAAPPSSAAANAGASPAAPVAGPVVGSTFTSLTHTAADWGLLTGVWNAIRDNNKPLLQFELSILARMADNLGGPGALFEHILLSYLEKQVAAGKATPLLTKIAQVAGVSERVFLDDVEGNAAAAAAPAAASPVKAATVASTLLVLALCLFGPTSSLTAAPLRGPERFEPADAPAVVDPPTFRVAVADRHALRPQQYAGVELIAPEGTQYQPGHCYQSNDGRGAWWQAGPARRAFSAPFRFFRNRQPLRSAFGFVFRRR